MPASHSSPWLSERMIARLSPLRQSNLARRLAEVAEDCERGAQTEPPAAAAQLREHARRRYAMLGRLSCMLAGGSHV